MDNIKISHFIITRFLIGSFYSNYYPKEDYILNGIRVMKTYLLPSLENQNCKNFTWILMIGDKVNITYVKYLFDFNISFEYMIIKTKDIKNYMRNITKGFDILITTRIDYDDIIYYDAVNDIRKTINIQKPILLHGYNRGIIYLELNDEYYDYYFTYDKVGCMSIFCSLIIVLNKINDIYTIYDIGFHNQVRKKLFENYKLYGIKELKYEPSIFDSGDPKFVWVRQKYSGSYNKTKQFKKGKKLNNFHFSKLFGNNNLND